MLIYLPQIVCVIGLVLYLVTDHPKASNVGLHMFWTGLLATLMVGVKL